MAVPAVSRAAGLKAGSEEGFFGNSAVDPNGTAAGDIDKCFIQIGIPENGLEEVGLSVESDGDVGDGGVPVAG